MPQHGFARTTNFDFVGGTDCKLTFKLSWSDETIKVYPYFSIGAHPAICCPIVADETFEDCYLKFNAEENSARLPLAASGDLTHDRIPTLEGMELALNYPLFKGAALVFDDLKSDEVTVCSLKSPKSLTLRAKGFPYWGIWTPAQGGAPFICIEPWHGHADYVDFAGELKDKEGIIKLDVGATFETSMSFIINN